MQAAPKEGEERQFSVAESNSRTYSSVSHYFLSLNTQHSYQLKECLKLEGGSWHNISYCLFLVLLDSFTTSVEFTPRGNMFQDYGLSPFLKKLKREWKPVRGTIMHHHSLQAARCTHHLLSLPPVLLDPYPWLASLLVLWFTSRQFRPPSLRNLSPWYRGILKPWLLYLSISCQMWNAKYQEISHQIFFFFFLFFFCLHYIIAAISPLEDHGQLYLKSDDFFLDCWPPDTGSLSYQALDIA